MQNDQNPKLSETDDKKCNKNNTRVASPASTSSVTSARPLEWDSGADVGYQYIVNTGLSTIEKIALSQKPSSSNAYNPVSSYTIPSAIIIHKVMGFPLAESTPFLKYSKDVTCDKNKYSHNIPYIDNIYYNNKAKDIISTDVINTYTIPRRRTYGRLKHTASKEKEFIVASSSSDNHVYDVSETMERSLSLNDLDYISGNHSSRSKGQQTYKGVRKYKKQNTDNNTLKPTAVGDKQKQPSSSIYNTVNCVVQDMQYCFKPISNDEVSSDNNTYTVNSTESEKQSTGKRSTSSNSTGKANSFEYLPGSAYGDKNELENIPNSNDSETTKCNTIDSESSMNSKVEHGVSLVTDYVNSLNVSNKSRLIKRLVETLVQNSALVQIDSEVTSNSRKETSTQCSSVKLNEKCFSNRRKNSRSSSYHDVVDTLEDFSGSSLTSSSHTRAYSTDTGRDDLTSYSDKSAAKTAPSIMEDNSLYASQSGSRIKTNLPRFEKVLSKSSSISVNSYETENQELRSQQKQSVQIDSKHMQQYLARERETQLLWIKSGIAHLNNLKRLFEQQRISKQTSKKNLQDIVKSSSTKTFSDQVQRLSGTENVLCEKNTNSRGFGDSSSQTSSYLNSRLSSTTKSSTDILNAHTEASKGKHSSCQRAIVSSLKLPPSSQKSKESTKSKHEYKVQQENKENIAIKNIASNSFYCPYYKTAVKNQNCSPCQKNYKQSISYTVCFVKTKPRKNQERCSKNRKSPYKRKVETMSSQMESLTLQDYLVKNKPEYISRAEFRRQCLSEIACLREIRSQMKKECVKLADSINEGVAETMKKEVPPPPLAVRRIFDQKTMRCQTERKYRQLPEVVKQRIDKKRQEEYKTNRILAQVFNKKLQKRALRGQVNLSNSMSIISS